MKIISLVSLVDIQQGKEYSVLGKYGANHIIILDDNMCERLLAHYEYVDAERERTEMKVKCLVTQQDVRSGVIYPAYQQKEDREFDGVDVIDDKGDSWYLTINEYEVVDEPV